MNIKSTTVGVLAGLLIGAPVASFATSELHPQTRWMERDCATPSSTNCFWSQGDGSAPSHYQVNRRVVNNNGRTLERITCVFFVNHKLDRKDGWCWKR